MHVLATGVDLEFSDFYASVNDLCRLHCVISLWVSPSLAAYILLAPEWIDVFSEAKASVPGGSNKLGECVIDRVIESMG